MSPNRVTRKFVLITGTELKKKIYLILCKAHWNFFFYFIPSQFKNIAPIIIKIIIMWAQATAFSDH